MFNDEVKLTDELKTPKKKNLISMRIIFDGKLVHMGLRMWIRKEATDLDIDGWVRYRGTSVEALFFGDDEIVKKMISKCHHAPAFSQVRRVRFFPQFEKTMPKGFFILSSIS